MKITVQINGNYHPEYIFETVPYLKGVALNGQKDHNTGYGPPMYWHEDYKERYRALVDTLAGHLMRSSHRDAILGIRQSYCAIGTENYYLDSKYRSQDLWTLHDSASWGGPWPWTKEIGLGYKTWAIDLFVDGFDPPDSIPVFMRASAISDGVATAEHVRMVEEGKLWIFHTSSEPQPRSDGKNEQYKEFVKYCKTGKTYSFMESWSKATTSSTGWDWTKTSKPIDLTQFNYWTLLCDLHCGATFPAMRPEDVDFAPFRSDYEFAAKYAGYIASPDSTPGAWIAFREGDYLVGDYTFLMERDPAYASQALYNVDIDRRGLWARRVPGDGTMRMTMDGDFSESLAGNRNVALKVWYRDEGTGSFSVEAFGQELRYPLLDSRTWKLAGRELIVPESNPEVLVRAGKEPLTLHMVEVLRGNLPSDEHDTAFMLTLETDGTPGAGIAPWGSLLVQADSATGLSVPAIPVGYRFSHWSVGPGNATVADSLSENTTVTLRSSGATVTALFEPTRHSLVTTIIGSGRVNASPEQEDYAYGTYVELTAQPDPEWLFGGWSGDVTDTAASIGLSMTEDFEITASFMEDTSHVSAGYFRTGSMQPEVSMRHDPANRQVIFGFGKVMPHVQLQVYRVDGTLERIQQFVNRDFARVGLEGLPEGLHLVRLLFRDSGTMVCRKILQTG